MKDFYKKISDLVLYAVLFLVIGIAALVKSIVEEDYDGANFEAGIVCIIVSSFILIRFILKNRK